MLTSAVMNVEIVSGSPANITVTYLLMGQTACC